MVKRSRKISGAQTLAVAIVSLPCSFALILLLALFTPMDPTERIFGSGLLMPIVWTAIALLGFLTRDALRTWIYLGTSTALASGLAALRLSGIL